MNSVDLRHHTRTAHKPTISPQILPCHRRHVSVPPNHCTPHAWRGAPSFICSASFSKSRIQSNTSLNNTAGLKVWINIGPSLKPDFLSGLPRDVHGTVGYQGFKIGDNFWGVAASIQVKKQLQQQVIDCIWWSMIFYLNNSHSHFCRSVFRLWTLSSKRDGGIMCTVTQAHIQGCPSPCHNLRPNSWLLIIGD